MKAPILFLVVFGAAFALLALLLVALVASGRVRAEEQWMLIAGIAALVLVATAFGWMLRLALHERKDG